MENGDALAIESKLNGPIAEANGFLPGTPGTTLSALPPSQQHTSNTMGPGGPPASFAGPEINGRPSTVSVFLPEQLADSSLLPSLYRTINAAFYFGHMNNGRQLLDRDRLRYDNQFLDELGNNPGTCTWIIHYADSNEVVATATIKRFFGKEAIVDKDYFHKHEGNLWMRLGTPAPDTAAWELSTMAVEPELMGRGLAGYVMKLAEDEVKRLFKVAADDSRGKGGTQLNRLLIMISTIKERNELFYEKRGFVPDYETAHEKGFLGSEHGFHVIHMTKVVELGELQKENGATDS